MINCLNCGKEFETDVPTKKYCKPSCRISHYQKRKSKGLTAGGGLTMKAKIDIIFNKVQELQMPVLKDSPNVSTVGTVFREQPMFKPSQQPIYRDFEYYKRKIRECELQDEYDILKVEIQQANLPDRQKQLLLTNRF